LDIYDPLSLDPYTIMVQALGAQADHRSVMLLDL